MTGTHLDTELDPATLHADTIRDAITAIHRTAKRLHAPDSDTRTVLNAFLQTPRRYPVDAGKKHTRKSDQ